MKKVADMASGDTVVDIGCDHGFVSIYLIKKGAFGRAIAMDLREGPLARARAHIDEYGLSDRISVRRSDGFEKLDCGEADVAVIAGMGGLLMTDILKKGRAHTRAGIGLVLQPQSDIDVVRAYVQEIDYEIVDEAILVDDGRYYFVIKALPSKNHEQKPYTEEELRFGPVLLLRKDELLKEYLIFRRNKLNEIRASLLASDTEKTKERLITLTNDMALIDGVLCGYDEVGYAL